MRHLLHSAIGLKSWCNHSEETGLVHRAAHIPEITDTASPLVKTHMQDVNGFDAVIHIVRNPLNAIASYRQYCTDFSVPTPPDFIRAESLGWQNHTEYWVYAVQSGTLEGILIRYEDLCQDPAGWLTKVIEFLGANVSKDAIDEAIRKCEITRLRERGGDRFYSKGPKRDHRDHLNYEARHLIMETTFYYARRLGYLQ